ncbi:MAG: hypothetical protein U0103_29935 [Candidatus Obscuribacterales bacterium]
MTSRKVALSSLMAISIGFASTACDAARAQKTATAGAVSKLTVELDTTGIAKTTKVEIVPKDPYGEDGDISLSGSPMHTRIIFDGKKLQYGDNSFNEPHLLIYPVAEYQALFPKKKQAEFQKIISDLKKVTAAASDKSLPTMPILPGSDGHEMLHAQIKRVNFTQGSGVSYVSVYGNGDPPVNESDFFYTFQGLTTDGRYYVSFFWPVKAAGMPKDLPLAKSQKYAENLARAKFVPSLETLDKVVGSISLRH